MQIEGWTLSSLGEIGKWSGGGTPSKAKKEFWENGNIPWVSPKDMWQKKISTTEDYITQSAVENSATKIYPKDSILVVTRSGILRKKLPVALAKIPVAVNQDIKVLTPNEKFSSEYLFNFMWCYNDSLLANCAKDGTTVESIDTTALLTYPINLPPLAEQKKIAEILSTWDKAIETVEKLVANSQQQKKALMQQLLTGQKRLLDDNGVRFSEDWEFYKVKDIFISESLTAKEQNYPVYSVTKNGLINQADYFNKSVASEDTSKYRVVNRGRFVMSGLNFWMGSVDVHLEDFPVIVSPAYKVFSISKLTSPSFMKQFIKGSEFGKLLETSSVVGASVVRRNFSESIFNNYELFLPNLEEQEKIAQVLTLADREIDLYQQQLDKLKLEKKSLMQQLLTGQKRVKLGGEY